MLVISTKFLIGVFVAFYASVASATPTAVTEDTTELLEARAPVDNKCGQMTWVRRECAPGRSGMAWDDVCENNHYNVKVAGLCPDNTVCEDTLEIDRPNNRVLEIIICVPIAPVGTAQPRKRAEDPQIGSSSKKQATNRYGVTQMHHEVFIADDMTASISAVILNDDNHHVVKPGNVIVGKLRGKGITACIGDTSVGWKYMECLPTGRYSMLFGDAVDFTWGMTTDDPVGSLKYLVSPS